MLNQIKPGHVLKFATDPATIVSPKGATNPTTNNNTLAKAWPTTSQLGLVQCISHPSGGIGAIAADVATHLRATPGSKARTTSYSGIGRALGPSDRAVASENCDFVGYVDGESNYIQSTNTVFSKDFSGCLMVVYSVGGQRRVAHAAASAVPTMDCKQAFLNTIRAQGAVLGGWFRPFIDVRDTARKLNAFAVISKYVSGINALTTFGVVTQAGQAYSIDAFQPTKPAPVPKGHLGQIPLLVVGKGAWVVTDVTPLQMSQSWTC